MTEKLKSRLVPGWQLWWRKWSTWLAAVAATIVATIIQNPSLFLGFIGFFPDGYRSFAAGAAFVLVLTVPVVTAHLKQKNLDAHR